MARTSGETWDKTLTKMWESRIIPDFIDRVLIYGYSRTGKSTLIHSLTGSERLTFHEGMQLEDIIGGLQLVNGSTKWVDGPAVRALRKGIALQIDELKEMPLECRTIVYALMDKPAAVTLPDGTRVEAAPGYCVIATQNPPPDTLPWPIYDRLDVFLKADTLSEGLKKALGPYAENAEAVIDRGQPKLGWERTTTVNAFLALVALQKAGVSDEEAMTMLGFTGKSRGDLLTIIADK